MSYQEPWNGQNRLKRTIMFPGIAMYYLKQHKVRISGVGAQYALHLRSLSATVQLKPANVITKEKLLLSYFLFLFPTQYTFSIHPILLHLYSTPVSSDTDHIHSSADSAKCFKSWRHDLSSLVWCWTIYLSSFPDLFPTWEKQSSSENCYDSNGVTTMFTTNSGFL